MTAALRRYPTASYFMLAIILSWACVYLVITGGEFPARPDRAEQLFPFVYLAMLVGPSVGGVLMTAVASGREGLREYGRRLLRWRTAASWCAVALLTAPAVLLATLAPLSLSSPRFMPATLRGSTAAMGPARADSVGSFALLGAGVGLGAGFFEELGWTGFAIPTMSARHGVLRTGVVVGLLWGAWHLLAVWWGSADAGLEWGACPTSLTVDLPTSPTPA